MSTSSPGSTQRRTIELEEPRVRVIVTPLLDKGVKRTSRAPPIVGDLLSAWDERHRQVLQLWEPGEPPKLMWNHLIHPQLSAVQKRLMVFHGYEQYASGQLVAQAWEVEPQSRR